MRVRPTPSLRRIVPALFVAYFLHFPLIAQADTIVLIANEDTAPYAFLPSLARHNNPTLYSFVDEDMGTPHDFETYLWFDVAAADIPQGHVLTDAVLVNTYAFNFAGFGEPSTNPATLECREVLEPWDQSTLTWSNRPASGPPFDSVPGITDFGAVLCNSRQTVFDWIYGVRANEGFALTNPTDRVLGMHSIESTASTSLMPTLVLTTALPEPGLGISFAASSILLTLTARRKRSRRSEVHE